MKIVITGASGFLGAWISRLFAEAFDVYCLVRQNSNTSRLIGVKNVTIINQDEFLWKNSILEIKPDVLIANDWAGVGNSLRNSTSQSANVRRILDYCEVARSLGVKTVVGVGSQAELGPINTIITEQALSNPTTEYGKAKVLCRQSLEQLFDGTETRFIWMRIFSTYGPMDIGEWLIPNLVESLSTNQEMKLTRCEQNWSYLHAYDLARAFKFAINHQDLKGIVNVGNPNIISLKTVVNEIARKMNSEHLLRFGEIPYRSDQVMNLMPACETLFSIGWKPTVGFESGITQTISWLMGKKANQLLSETGELLTFNLPARSEIFQ